MNPERRSPLLTPELKAAIVRLPRYARLAWSLARDPRVPPGAKAILAGGVLYSVSPIDLVPGFIPVVGQLDDLLVLLATLAQALRAIEPDASAALLKEADLTQDNLAADRQAVAAALGTAARETWRLSKAGARAAARVAGRAGVAGVRLAGQAGSYAWQALLRGRRR
ncbi:MAG: YkvA family protein [Bacillota bacterium]